MVHISGLYYSVLKFMLTKTFYHGFWWDGVDAANESENCGGAFR